MRKILAIDVIRSSTGSASRFATFCLSMLLASPAASAEVSPAGTYRAHIGPDAASELVLQADGKFEYFLAAGSLDEHAQGIWRVEGTSLRLTTLPKPVPAVFSPGQISSTAEGKLVLHVVDPAGRGIAGVDFALGFDRGEPLENYTQEYGWTLDHAEKRMPRWIEFSVPIYQLKSPRFTIDPAKGNVLTFVLTPNDLGTIDFSGMEINIVPNGLIVHRNGALMTFERATPEGP